MVFKRLLMPNLILCRCILSQYDDLCRVLDVLVEEFGNKEDNSTQCPDYFNQITPPAPCHCPLPKGIYKLAPHTFKVKELSTLYSVFASVSVEILKSLESERGCQFGF